jgi:hypothetical protein
MRRTIVTCLSTLLALWAVWLFQNDLTAMTNFARKTGLECTSCHTVVPKLTEMGYRYRAAGFRMPDEINNPPDYKEIGQFFAFRVQNRIDAKRKTVGGTSTNEFQFTNHELTIYPATGAFAKRLASEVEVSWAADEPLEFENAYVRWVSGTEEGFWSARLGIFHPFEGYGAADRPVSLARPLFQTSSANFTQNTFFTLWEFDQFGLEMAYNFKSTSIAGTVFNGLFSVDDGLEPAKGGELQKPAGSRSQNAKDYQVFVSQRLTDDGGGLSAQYYRGTDDLPIGTTGDFFQNNFHRAALYGSYPVTDKVVLLLGGALGMDQYYNPASGSTKGRFGSGGGFGEIDLYAHPQATLAGRFDWYDPSDRKKDNEVWAATGAVNVPFNNGFQLVGQYQYKLTKQGTAADKKEHLAQLRAIVIF